MASGASDDRDGTRTFDDGPPRGTVACYVTHVPALEVVRASCKAARLELEVHGGLEIPNPAAHRDGIVLFDVPVSEDKRFGWSTRLKAFDSDIRVVLLLHEPSRDRVYKGFRANADAILGLPVTADELTAKLEALLEQSPLR